MKVMSFNTQHCRNFLTKEIDYARMAEVINRYAPDIVGLNEMRDTFAEPGYDKQTEILASLCGYQYHSFAKAIEVRGSTPFAYGNGFLSKYKIDEVTSFPIALPKDKRTYLYYESRVLMKVRLENGYTVLVTHFGLSLEEKLQAVKIVVENLEEEKCILMGDFNVRPDGDILLPIRDRMKDCASVCDKEILTFPSDNPDRKIDYIFVSPDIEVLNFGAENFIASDHFPITAEIY